MISDEDLRRIAEDYHVHCGDASAMAREIQAYRQAFSEPYAYEVKGILCHTPEEAKIFVSEIGEPEPLFLKPIIPE